MPTYEYQCTECGKITDVFQPITEPARRKLKASDNPQCDCAEPVTRLIGTGAGVIFKGSGFYQTDYRSEGYKKAAKADKEAAEGKPDSKDKSKTSKAVETKKTKPSEKKHEAGSTQ